MHSVDSPLATAALLLWFPISIALFTNMPSYKAACVCLFGGLLFLPSAHSILIPLLPDLDRRSVPMVALLFCNLVLRKRLFQGVRLGTMPWVFFALFIVSDIARVLANSDDLRFGTAVTPGIPPHTMLTFMMDDALIFGTMLGFGAAIGSDPERLRTFLRVWFISALLYLPFVAIEVRLSPRVHIWIYGYLQHDYMQLVRQGGWRPIIFMSHGLEVAMFMAASTAIACALSGSQMKAFGLRPRGASWVMIVFVVLCKSAAALVYATVAFVLSKFGGPKKTITVVRVLVFVILTYPMLRLGGWITAETPRQWMSMFETDRVESIVFRMLNEDMMLEKLLERPWTGWGGFARIGVFDPESGATLTIPDGSWIIEAASGGIPRFVAMFGLLTLPALGIGKLVAKLSRSAPEDARLFATLALTCILLVLDLLPNGLFNLLSFLVAGVLCGILDRMKREPVAYWPTIARPN